MFPTTSANDFIEIAFAMLTLLGIFLDDFRTPRAFHYIEISAAVFAAQSIILNFFAASRAGFHDESGVLLKNSTTSNVNLGIEK